MKINNVTPVISNEFNNPNNNVAFTGHNIKPLKEIVKDEFKSFFTLQRSGPMSRHLFCTNAFVFLLGSRLVTSRDKDEKREILIRDLPSICAAVFGVPFFQKIIENKLQGLDGIATKKLNNAPGKSELSKWISVNLLNKDVKDLEKNQKQILEGLSYNQIKSLYKYDENLASGLTGFSERLSGLNDKVDLKKMYSKLSKEIEQEISTLKATNNKEFITELKSNEQLSGKIIEALKSDKNVLLRKAEFLKTIPIMSGFAITLTLLGIIVPKTNIFITETINKRRELKKKSENVDNEIKTQTLPKAGVNESKKTLDNFATNK